MKFFIPDLKSLPEHMNEDDMLELYDAVRKFSRSTTPLGDLTDNKIHSLKYNHNGKIYTETVGVVCDEGLVMCILETTTVFLVCTPNRGVVRGNPIIVGKNDVLNTTYFDK